MALREYRRKYSTRTRPGCRIATPIEWAELTKLLSATEFTIASVPTRLTKLKRDPWEQFFQVRQSLSKSILRAAAAVAES